MTITITRTSTPLEGMRVKPRSYDELTKTERNVVNLAGQVLAGEFTEQHEDDKPEERLRNQVMRLWRGVDFEAPEEGRLYLVTDEPGGVLGQEKDEGGEGDEHPSSETGSQPSPTASPEPDQQDASPESKPFQDGCEEASKHAVVARPGTKYEACPGCGGTHKAD